MGASKAALILMKNSHFDRTLQYLLIMFTYVWNFDSLENLEFAQQFKRTHRRWLPLTLVVNLFSNFGPWNFIVVASHELESLAKISAFTFLNKMNAIRECLLCTYHHSTYRNKSGHILCLKYGCKLPQDLRVNCTTVKWHILERCDRSPFLIFI